MSLIKTGFFCKPTAAAIIDFLIGADPNIAFAHSANYWYGYNICKQDGNGGIYEPGDACQNALADGKITNSDHCDSGYYDGFYSILFASLPTKMVIAYKRIIGARVIPINFSLSCSSRSKHVAPV
jgi:hypothetical protein